MKLITEKKLNHYFKITSQALDEAKKSSCKNLKEHRQEFLQMIECYYKDAQHFKKNKDFVNSFASLNYAHGWLDAGARLKIFNVKNTNLFSV
ncbi:MAG: DUF357 domain-containing protein [Nanoarchaeota archaeon]|nr:DUF357 domain-containing protein [Nanoarchaeota archaeon]